MTDRALVRVSTGSQDAQTQIDTIHAVYPDAIIHQPDGAASASKGEHLDVVDKLIAKLVPGDRVIVTESSRLDRDPDQWAQMRRLIEIKATGARVIVLNDPSFGSDDRMGVVLTALHQMESADKSREVKSQTMRGMRKIAKNGAFRGGTLPMFWSASGERYNKRVACTDPETVRSIYERVADGASISSVARDHDVYPKTVRELIKWPVNHTGILPCSFSCNGETLEWVHKVEQVEPVVDSALWWRANKAADARAPKVGRPVSYANNWISGVLDCPECGGNLYLQAGNTPQGYPRTPKLRCGGMKKRRLACGKFKGCDAQPVIDAVDKMFTVDETPIMAFQRVSGNAHELDERQANLARLMAQPTPIDRAERRTLLDSIERLEDEIALFVVVLDSFDYAPTGDTVGSLWRDGDDTVKRSMLRAIKTAMGVDVNPDDPADLYVGVIPAETITDGIVDLGGGICFRKEVAA